MSISEVQFDCEKELHDWAVTNIHTFLPNAIFIPGFQVATTSGKKGVPDGFAFDFRDREWFVVESELLRHGVWPHIAEQIVRFVVAMQNGQTRRKVRDRIFNYLIESGKSEETASILETTPQRLLQKLELFIEGIQPEVVIFIDQTNQDLYDMAQALSAATRVFRIQKFVVNGQPEYHSPDRNTPVLDTETADVGVAPETDFDLIDILGGGTIDNTHGRFKCYQLLNGNIVHIKRSKFYADSNYYWYGINASTLACLNEFRVTHIVFVMGEDGCAVVPLDTVTEFVKSTKASLNADGSVRHYHALISPPPEPTLYWSNETPRFTLSDWYITF